MSDRPCRIVVWGMGHALFSIRIPLARLREEQKVQTVAFTASTPQPMRSIDGMPFVDCRRLMAIDFDMLVVCAGNVLSQVLTCIRDLGVPAEKIVGFRALLSPHFDPWLHLELAKSRVSIFSGTCWGGFVYQILGLECLSPFKNLWLGDKDYLRLLADPRHYLLDLDPQPAGFELVGDQPAHPLMALGDVTIHCNHDPDHETAIARWRRGCEKVNWDNVFVEMSTTSRQVEEAFHGLGLYPSRLCLVSFPSAHERSVCLPYVRDAPGFSDVVHATRFGFAGDYELDLVKLLLGREDFLVDPATGKAAARVAGVGFAPGTIKTSVVMPVYNTKDYLEECVRSVLAQTQTEIEVILVDDGSTDGSLEVERKLAAEDPRVRVIEQPNLRQGTARNTGIAAARGEFIYLMDSDDIIEPTLFETCYEAAQADDLDFVTFDSRGFLDNPDVARPELFTEVRDRTGDGLAGRVYDGQQFWEENFTRGNVLFVCWLHYIRSSFLKRCGITFVPGIYHEDNDWILRLYLAARRLRYLPLTLHRYRERPDSNVHSGFKPVLADSSLDIHFILTDLLSEQDGPERRRMVENVLWLNYHRLERFGELACEPALLKRTQEFCDELATRVKAGKKDQDVFNAHLCALKSLSRGCAAWSGLDVPDLNVEFARTLLDGCPLGREGARVGIYGTGKICECLLAVTDVSDMDVVFLQTGRPDDGATFRGKSLRCIDDAAGMGLDAVVIASTKYRDEMLAAAHGVLGPDIETFCLPRGLLMVGD